MLVQLEEPCGQLLRGVAPTGLLDYARWDPAVGVTDAEVLAEPLRFYQSMSDALLFVDKDASSSAVITGLPNPRYLRWKFHHQRFNYYRGSDVWI